VRYTRTPESLFKLSTMAPAAITPPSTPGGPQKPTLYLLDTFHPQATALAESLFTCIHPTDKAFASWRQDARYILVRGSYVTADDIANAPHLKAIGKQGVGIDKVDAAACAERGIKIFNTPGVNARAVAELVVALSTGLARQIRPISVKVSNGEVVRKEQCSGLILHKSTVGVIGMGNIGKTVAKIFKGGYESDIVAYDPYMPESAWEDLPHKCVRDLNDLLAVSDVVTVHVPLTPETKGLIGLEQMKGMKANALLINTARGGIVNENDLVTALGAGYIWGAGLDCHEQEPPTKERYEQLWSHPNVISLPHVGAATAQTQMETAIAAVERLHAYVQIAEANAALKQEEASR
jgi:phosphoglycerate dehydrogenase-like enzyme